MPSAPTATSVASIPFLPRTVSQTTRTRLDVRAAVTSSRKSLSKIANDDHAAITSTKLPIAPLDLESGMDTGRLEQERGTRPAIARGYHDLDRGARGGRYVMRGTGSARN